MQIKSEEVTAIVNTHTHILLDEEGDVGQAGQVEQVEGLLALHPSPPPPPPRQPSTISNDIFPLKFKPGWQNVAAFRREQKWQ